MQKHAWIILAAGLCLIPAASAKDKKKVLPAYLLQAHTVSVIIDPNAGVSIEDPQANRLARQDVETALLHWGRFAPVNSTESADLIIVLRKGSGRMVNQVLTDPRENRRPGSIDSSDSGMSAGAQHGQQPSLSGDPGSGPGPGAGNMPRPETEIGEGDDSFAVYQGHVAKPLDSAPAWRYVARDGLRSPGVPAVVEFRKALAEADKAAAKNP